VVVRVAGTTVALPDLGEEDAFRLHRDLARAWP
jgi:hypothetical protein